MKIDFTKVLSTAGNVGKKVSQVSVPAVIVGAGTMAVSYGTKLCDKVADELVNGKPEKEEPKKTTKK